MKPGAKSPSDGSVKPGAKPPSDDSVKPSSGESLKAEAKLLSDKLSLEVEGTRRVLEQRKLEIVR